MQIPKPPPEIDSEVLNNLLLDGELWEYSLGMQKWSKRYYVLSQRHTGDYLLYQSESSSGFRAAQFRKIKLSIRCRLIYPLAETYGKTECFQLNTNEDILTLACQTTNELNEWTSKLRTALQNSQTSGSGYYGSGSLSGSYPNQSFERNSIERNTIRFRSRSQHSRHSSAMVKSSYDSEIRSRSKSSGTALPRRKEKVKLNLNKKKVRLSLKKNKTLPHGLKLNRIKADALNSRPDFIRTQSAPKPPPPTSPPPAHLLDQAQNSHHKLSFDETSLIIPQPGAAQPGAPQPGASRRIVPSSLSSSLKPKPNIVRIATAPAAFSFDDEHSVSVSAPSTPTSNYRTPTSMPRTSQPHNDYRTPASMSRTPTNNYRIPASMPIRKVVKLAPKPKKQNEEDRINKLELSALFERIGLNTTFIDPFIKENVTVGDLPYLTENDLKELMPLKGPRSRLRRYLQEQKQHR